MVDNGDKDAKIEDLEHQLFHQKKMDEERAISDSKYAIKLVEKIVFGLVALVLVAFATALIALVVR